MARFNRAAPAGRILLVVLVLATGACGARTLPGDAEQPDGSTGGLDGGSSDAPAIDVPASDSSLEPSDASLDVDAFDVETAETGPVDESAPDAVAPDSAPAFFGPVCPVIRPGGPCPVVGAACEYGDNANARCDVIDVCDPQAAGGWISQQLLDCTASCPVSFSDIVPGDSCPTTIDCGYPEGQCNCSSAPADSGAEAGTMIWSCYAPSGCPEPRPRLGAYCSPRGLECDYGTCTGGIAQVCTLVAGWVEYFPTCP